MFGKLSIWVVAIASVVATSVPYASAQGNSPFYEMGDAQRACDKGRWELAKESALRGIDAEIDAIDGKLSDINNSVGEQRARDQRRAVELILERQELTRLRRIYARQRFVVCDAEEDDLEYVRVCDAYGAGFFYIPGTETCLKIDEDGVVRRSVLTGGSDFSESEDAGVYFSDVSIGVNPFFTLSAPVLRGHLAFEEPLGTLHNPAFTQELIYEGKGLSIGVDFELGIGSFKIPTKIGIDIFESMAWAYDENIATLPNFGVQQVGNEVGSFVGFQTDILSSDVWSTRSGIMLDNQFGILFANGDGSFGDHPYFYDAQFLIGTRFGHVSQLDTATIETLTPAYGADALSTINYETSYEDFIAGANVGIGIGKSMGLDGMFGGQDPLTLRTRLSASVGFDAHNLHVTDSVDANILNGTATEVGTNELDFFLTTPTARLSAQLGIGAENWELYVNGGISTGYSAYYDVLRPDSEAPATPLDPEVSLVPGLTYDIGAGFLYKF